eukprot:4660040-Pyramimonas_sp.AAC.1
MFSAARQRPRTVNPQLEKGPILSRRMSMSSGWSSSGRAPSHGRGAPDGSASEAKARRRACAASSTANLQRSLCRPHSLT